MYTNDGECLTLWESLDRKAPPVSLRETGRAAGFGPGLRIHFLDFNSRHRTLGPETGVNLAFTGGSPLPNPKQRPSVEEKTAAKRAMVAMEDAYQKRKRESEARAEEHAATGHANAAPQCPRCRKSVLTPGGLTAHQG